MEKPLPPIPNKRYFTIGETSVLCGVKAYVLRYWEQEFTQLKPMKRRGNRRYYQHGEVQLIRRIRALLYDEGFTISGARNRLAEEIAAARRGQAAVVGDGDGAAGSIDAADPDGDGFDPDPEADDDVSSASGDDDVDVVGARFPRPPSAASPVPTPPALAGRTVPADAAATAPVEPSGAAPWRDPLLVRAAAWAVHAPSYAPPPMSSAPAVPRPGAVQPDWPDLMAELLSIRSILSP